MILDRPFATVTPTVDGDVLSVLARADAEFTPPQLHRIVDEHSVEGIRNALRRLAGQGIVNHRRAGNAVLYSLNRDHLAASAVIEIANLRDVLISRVQTRISEWTIPPTFASLFGSAANGEMKINSDLDLFVVRPQHIDADDPTWRSQIDELSRAATLWTGNDARVLEYSETEVDRATGTGDAVLKDVRDVGLRIFGDVRILRRRNKER
jgi:predicted nucleotidyltransferase